MPTIDFEAPLSRALYEVLEGRDLSFEAALEAATSIMRGEASDARIAALLAALRVKGESVDEIRGFVVAMRRRSLRIAAPAGAVDPCGTGGDGGGTFNVSTAVAFVAAAAGCPIAKHGNRSVSSRCGSADVLEALGVDPAPEPEAAAADLRELGLCFLYAPRFHEAARHAAGARREIGARTLFNLVGPLTNPAGCRRQLVGVFDARWTEPLANVLAESDAEHALVVHGLDGLDEISISAPTRISELRHERVETRVFDPREIGFRLHPPEAVRGGDARTNAAILRDVFAGRRGAPRDLVLLNAAAALYLGGLAATIDAGVARAASAIDDGAAAALLDRFRARTRRLRDARPA